MSNSIEEEVVWPVVSPKLNNPDASVCSLTEVHDPPADTTCGVQACENSADNFTKDTLFGTKLRHVPGTQTNHQRTARRRPKEEIKRLEREVTALQYQLSALLQSKFDQADQKSDGGSLRATAGNAEWLSQLLGYDFDIQDFCQWKVVAARRTQEIARARLLNKQLRAMAQEQASVMNQMWATLHQGFRSMPQALELLGMTAPMHCVTDPWDDIFIHLNSQLDRQCTRIHEMVGVDVSASSSLGGLDSHINGMHYDINLSATLPFSVPAIQRAMWRFVSMTLVARNGDFRIVDAGTVNVATSHLMFVGCSSAIVKTYLAFRQFVDHGRIASVWNARIDFEGINCAGRWDEGWGIVVPTMTESSQSQSAIRAVAQLTPDTEAMHGDGNTDDTFALAIYIQKLSAAGRAIEHLLKTDPWVRAADTCQADIP